MRRAIPYSAVFVALLFAPLTEPGARAQDPLPVKVAFSFSDAATASRYKSAQPVILDSLIATLDRTCRFWKFASNVDGVTELRFQALKQTEKWDLVLELWNPIASRVEKQWSMTLFGPGVVARMGLPSKSQWPLEVKRAFQAGLLTDDPESLFGSLRSFAPLGKEVALTASAMDAVLPLSWDVYQGLAVSKFRIACRLGAEMVTLHSEGCGVARSYLNANFQGIVVRHARWSQGNTSEKPGNHLNEYKRLKPASFYLEQYLPAPAGLARADH
jgi:hypothetical protein